MRIESLLDYAEELGLNRGEFTSCMTNSTHVNTIQASREEAVSLGVQSTPTLFVNGTMMNNAFDMEAISGEIERILDES